VATEGDAVDASGEIDSAVMRLPEVPVEDFAAVLLCATRTDSV